MQAFLRARCCVYRLNATVLCCRQYDLPIFIDPELHDDGSDEDEDADEDDEQFKDLAY